MQFRRILLRCALVSALAVPGFASGRPPAVGVRIVDTPVPVAVTSSVPVQVVGEARQPLQRQFSLDWAAGVDLATGTFVVPTGQRFVIEYASLSAYLPDGQTMFLRVVTTVNGSDAFHTMDVRRGDDWGVLAQFGAAHPVRIYADPGSTIRVSAGRVAATGTANCTLTVSGYLEPVP
jgi:hypothetical protein